MIHKNILPIGRDGVAIKMGEKLSKFEPVANLFIQTIGHLEHEELWILYVSKENTMMAYERAGTGTNNHVKSTHAEMIGKGVKMGAAGMIVTHNHPEPEGDDVIWDSKPIPSYPDIFYTIQLGQAADLAGIALLDHIVVTADKATSIRQEVIGDAADIIGNNESDLKAKVREVLGGKDPEDLLKELLGDNPKAKIEKLIKKIRGDV